MFGNPGKVRHFLIELLGAAFERRLEHAVHDEVGIAPDRRGEMRIRITSKRIVAIELCRVDCSLHRAEHERRHERRLTPTTARFENLVDHLRIASYERIRIDRLEPGEFLQHGHKSIEALARWLLVHTVDTREPSIPQEACHRFVCSDHCLFDELSCVGALPQLVVEANLGFNRIEVDATRGLASSHALFGEGRELQHTLINLIGNLARVAIDTFLSFVVSEPSARPNERWIDVDTCDATICVEHHVDCHGTSRFMRAQRANVVRQRFRQHRHDAVDEIHTRCTPASVQIDRRGPWHVVPHIGNVHAEPPFSIDAIDGHGVIVITRICWIDREDNAIPYVAVTSR